MVDEALTAGAVARQLGIAVTTLRSWHQRYGLGPSRHTPGQHRRYTAEDLERLQVMRRLIGQGIAPAEAAAWAGRVPLPVLTAMPQPGTARDGGGQAIALGQAHPAARGLARAAMRLDAEAMRDILTLAITELGVIDAWEVVAMPVLIGIGERYAATERFIEVEHLASRTITEVLGAIPRPDSAGVSPRVLLAAADEEQHTLPLEALAAGLAQIGVASRLLGARVPAAALGEAIIRTGPMVVVLWSQLACSGDPALLIRVATGPRPPLLLVAAGPGWPMELPLGVAQPTSLTEAVKLVQGAVA